MKHLVPVDFEDVCRQTLIREGKLCFSARWGWGVLSDSGFFARYDPPAEVGGRFRGGIVKNVRIVSGLYWEIKTIDTEVRPIFEEIKFF